MDARKIINKKFTTDKKIVAKILRIINKRSYRDTEILWIHFFFLFCIVDNQKLIRKVTRFWKKERKKKKIELY